MIQLIINIFSAVLIPLLFPLLSYLIANVNIKPVKLINKNGKKVLFKEINIFLKELPTAYLSNILWNFTFTATSTMNESFALWIIYCFIMLIIQFFIILYVHGTPNIRIYYFVLIIFGIAILVFTALRLFL
jgi:hypothetical protein